MKKNKELGNVVGFLEDIGELIPELEKLEQDYNDIESLKTAQQTAPIRTNFYIAFNSIAISIGLISLLDSQWLRLSLSFIIIALNIHFRTKVSPELLEKQIRYNARVKALTEENSLLYFLYHYKSKTGTNFHLNSQFIRQAYKLLYDKQTIDKMEVVLLNNYTAILAVVKEGNSLVSDFIFRDEQNLYAFEIAKNEDILEIVDCYDIPLSKLENLEVIGNHLLISI